MAALLVGLFVLGLVAVFALYRPWEPAISYDSSASVIYFDRLASQQTLEGFVATTPKPLVTLINGATYNLLHDWRPLELLSTIEFAAMLAMAALLCWRTSGPVAAGMAASGLLGSQRLLWDGLLTEGYPWAILLWLAAGLALTTKSPRYGLAGAALLLAALVRLETFLILGTVVVTLLVWQLAPQRWVPGGRRPPVRAWLLLAGLAALPIMCLHDWLLTRDAFFWLNVSAVHSARLSSAVQTPGELSQSLVSRGWSALLLAGPLGVVGGVDLLRRRQLVVLLGLATLGPGVLAFLIVLAFRHLLTPSRYVIPVDAALVLASAFGVQALAGLVVGAGRRIMHARMPGLAVRPSFRSRAHHRLGLGCTALAVGALAAVVVARPYGPLDQSTLSTMKTDVALQTNAQRVMPTISAAIRAMPAAAEWSRGNLAEPVANTNCPLYVPSMLVPRMVVDLGMPIWAIAAGSPMGPDPSALRITGETIVYIDDAADTNPAVDVPLRVLTPTRVGHALVTPLLALPESGLWVLELTPTPG
jgi:hypothetical protein